MIPYRALLALIVVLAGAAHVPRLARLLTDSTPRSFPWDFAINYTAARGQLAGVSLYDWGALHRLARAEIGEPIGEGVLFQSLYSSYISPPTTALLILPFALLSFPIATGLYRLALGIAFVLAVGVLARTLPDEHRLRGWAYGLAGLATLNGVTYSLLLGQVDAWIVLALAVAAYGLHVRRPVLAGAGVAVAALIKVSPGLLLLYLLIRREWRVALAAAAVGIALLTIELVAGRPGDLARFGLEITPALSQGSLHWQNQALPALAARLTGTGSGTGPIAYEVGLGGWRVLSLGVAALGVAGLAWRRRGQPVTPLECGAVAIVALLAGPITWDHYASWVILVLVPLAGVQLGPLATGLVLLAMALLFLPITYEPVDTIDWLRASATTVGMVVLLVGVWLGLRPTTRTDTMSPP